ncbi:MAG: bifunctional phosphopantothenoylcysteine decarboxylase/phosphopantothenate--cysteine ligase CoaBC [Actinomycetota bacterium]|nr:bifunctional phosphopantothenoylcysteine decarboxylase/phosphopantothenate--cysteine ligase CoaBC [Actinomycetota bacterium]MED5233111.1 bifunctional phosphopantothenoylcysteine decarboxylase/phosphopantothenate--cysteine ligase CoaBC [Actinomycetota bacterium]MEE3353317.1 bifunctional phosphopantothenoylcysteine decarboxylase/phosphopantothenate--cysteine ligase CoaBC [Actinomycetota bacterium]
MGPLAGCRIVLGVTGGVAAYKAVEVCRRLIDAGAYVAPVMTDGAMRFVGRATFDALASEPVQTSLWDEPHPIPHTRLGQGADLIVVCPATARLLSDYRTGRSEDLLTATLMATRAPVIVAPAMHTEMWEQPSVVENVAVLTDRGVTMVGPVDGRLAGGDSGVGRMADPAEIVAAAFEVLGVTNGGEPAGDLAGMTVLVTAGGTREPVCPVRFLGNRSSGKQGHALATEAMERGAKVHLVTTQPTTAPDDLGLDVVAVDTAAEMASAVLERSPGADVVLMAAAVADFRPVDVADRKIKKDLGVPELRLEPTIDILAELGRIRTAGQVLVVFAAETDDLRQNAAAKLQAKGVDLIVANDVSAPEVGFEHDTNAVVLLDASGGATEVPLCNKREVACAVIDAAVQIHRTNHIGTKRSLNGDET